MTIKEKFLKDISSRTEESAKTFYIVLCRICHELNLVEAKKFIIKNENYIKKFLLINVSMSKLIASFTKKCPQIPIEPKQSPSLVCNIAAVLNLLRYNMHNSGEWESTNYNRIFEDVLKELATNWVEACVDQIAQLEKIIIQILDFIQMIAIRELRIILTEFPIGNSIPLHLLKDILAHKNYNVELVKIALSRNDSQSIGLTRKQLIEQKLSEIKLGKDDLIIYFDEWLTGANYYNLSKKLYKLVSARKAFLYPIAALSIYAEKSERYNTFITNHDNIASKIGLNGKDLRISFPNLNPGATQSDQTFFWSENDRLAGYRKMQHVGSILGSIFEVVEEIQNNHERREDVRICYLQKIAEQKNIENELFIKMHNDRKSFETFVNNSYKDFLKWKKEIEQIFHESNLGLAKDSEKSLIEICQIIADKTEGRKAKDCVSLAAMWIRKTEIDPRDQYYSKSHIPVISDLSDNLRRFHDLFYDKLMQKIRLDLNINILPNKALFFECRKKPRQPG